MNAATSFGRYEFHTKIMGGEPIFINFPGFPFEFDVHEIIKLSKKIKPKLLFLANPNNPTGHYIEKEKIINLVKNLKQTFIVIDESLIDYLEPDASCVGLTKRFSNLIATRSFSKLYGLAGMRIGYLASNKNIIKQISKTISPFEACSFAITSAITVLDDYNHLKKSKLLVEKNLKSIKSLPLKSTNSSCSTILIECNTKRHLHPFLLERKIRTVSCEHFRGLEKRNAVRINLAASRKEIQKLCKALNKF